MEEIQRYIKESLGRMEQAQSKNQAQQRQILEQQTQTLKEQTQTIESLSKNLATLQNQCNIQSEHLQCLSNTQSSLKTSLDSLNNIIGKK